MKTRKELEENIKETTTALIIFIGLFVFMFCFMFSYYNDKVDLKQQLSECQDEIPIRESVLFIKCDDGTLLNLLVDENNRTLYDYYIPKNCEVIE